MFDANQLKEHEEFTKVKNVELIELGRYEMETWYFSPLPEEFRECKVSLGRSTVHESPQDTVSLMVLLRSCSCIIAGHFETAGFCLKPMHTITHLSSRQHPYLRMPWSVQSDIRIPQMRIRNLLSKPWTCTISCI